MLNYKILYSQPFKDTAIKQKEAKFGGNLTRNQVKIALAELARRRANGENPNHQEFVPRPPIRPVAPDLPRIRIEDAVRYVLEIQRLPEPLQEGLLPRYWDLSRQ